MGFLTDPSVMNPIQAGTGALATLAGGRMEAQGAKAAGVAASNADLYNAGVATTNAQIALTNATAAGQAGEANVGISESKTREAVAGIKASQAASGVDVGSVSASNVRGSEAAKGMLDALTIRANAAKQAYGFQQEAVNAKSQADLLKSQAAYDASAGKTKASAVLLNSYTTAAKGFQEYMLQNSLNAGGGQAQAKPEEEENEGGGGGSEMSMV